MCFVWVWVCGLTFIDDDVSVECVIDVWCVLMSLFLTTHQWHTLIYEWVCWVFVFECWYMRCVDESLHNTHHQHI